MPWTLTHGSQVMKFEGQPSTRPPIQVSLSQVPPEQWSAIVQREKSRSLFDASWSPQSALQYSMIVLEVQRLQNKATEGLFTVDIAKTLMRIGSLQQMLDRPELALSAYRQALDYWTASDKSATKERWQSDILSTLRSRIEQLSKQGPEQPLNAKD